MPGIPTPTPTLTSNDSENLNGATSATALVIKILFGVLGGFFVGCVVFVVVRILWIGVYGGRFGVPLGEGSSEDGDEEEEDSGEGLGVLRG